MNNARKDEIQYKFIINKNTDIKELRKLEIQEIIFLISAAEYFKKENAFDVDFDNKIEIFTKILIENLQVSESLFIAYNNNICYPYIDENDRALLFSKEDIGKKTKEEIIEKEGADITICKIDKDNYIKKFKSFNKIGINKILIDKGACDFEIELCKIWDLKDESEIKDNYSQIINPCLIHSGIKYFQFVDKMKVNNDLNKDLLEKLKEDFFIEMLKADYLVPISKNKDEREKFIKKDELPFGMISGKDNKNYIAVFSDIDKFLKNFSKSYWDIYLLSYDDIRVFIEENTGFVINYGCARAVYINEENISHIDKLRQKIRRTMEAEEEEEKLKIEKSKTKIVDPEKYPVKLIYALRKYMKKKKEINSAYLREVHKNEEASYLVVIDYEGSEGEIFKEVCSVSLPYLKGKNIDVIDIDSSFGKKAVENAKPFYKSDFLEYFRKFKAL